MLENFLRTKMEEYENTDHFWFQQDGATAHTVSLSHAILQDIFYDRLTSLRQDVARPPCSSDLTPCDFFILGYLKTVVFNHRPRTPEELKEAIREKIAGIPYDMLANVMGNFR